MKELHFFKMPGTNCLATQCHLLTNSNAQQHCCEDLKLIFDIGLLNTLIYFN